MINATEEGTNIAITGTVGGDVADGDTVTLTVNSVAYTGTVSSGAFSIEVPGTGLTADGDLTIDARVTTTDTAGNSTTATDTETYTVDTTGPVVSSVVMSDSALTVGETSTLTITFSKAVTGFDNSDITLENGTLSAVSSSDGGVTWTGTFTPTDNITDSSNVITVGTSLTDLAGNSPLAGGTTINYTIDTTPVVTSNNESQTSTFSAGGSINLTFIVDVSSSMSDTDIDLTEDAIASIVNQVAANASVNVQVIQFWGNNSAGGGTWTSVSGTYSLDGQLYKDKSGTDPEQGLRAAVDSYDGTQPTASTDLVFFLGDGDPYDAYETDYDNYLATWQNFANNVVDDARGYGINTSSLSILSEITSTGTNPVYVSSIIDFADIVSDITVPLVATFTGDLIDNISGGDGSYSIDSIEIGGSTYLASAFANSATVPISGVGELSIDFSAGTYQFTLAAADATGVSALVFTVNASDSAGKSTDFDVTLNLNSAPTIATPSNSTLAENTGDTTTIIATFTASDSDSDSVTFAITSGNASGYFVIDGSTGAVSLTATGASALNSATLADVTYDLGVTASDGRGGSSSEAVVSITFDAVDGLIFSSSSSISNDTFSSDSNADQVTTAKADSITLTDKKAHIDDSVITTGAGDDVISIIGEIKGTSNVNMGADDDELTTKKVKEFAEVDMGDGDDTVNIAQKVENDGIVRGGTGDDTIIIGDDVKGDAQIDGGGDDDTITIGAEIKDNSSIDGGTGSDTIILNNYSYSDWNSIKDHIDNFEIVQFSNGDRYNIAADKTLTSAPIAIDLDGDGIEYLGLDAGVTFASGSDEAIRTAWVAAGDALLVFDANNSGTVDASREYVFTEWAEAATSDMAALREVFDTNQDDVLDASDDNWDQFKVWQDANSDGVTDEGELKSLDEVGITSIALTYNETSEASSEAGGDVLVAGQSDVTWADGRVTQAEDTAFAIAAADDAPATESEPSDAANSAGLLLGTDDDANLAWALSDEGGAADDASMFALQSDEGEAISLADLLGDVAQDDLADYIRVESDGLNTVVSINPDGLGSDTAQQQSLTIEGVDLTTDTNGNALDTDSMNELLRNLYNGANDTGLM